MSIGWTALGLILLAVAVWIVILAAAIPTPRSKHDDDYWR